MIHYFILLFLSSPALSLIGIIGLPYFPNEKLAFLLILYLIYKYQIKIKTTDLVYFFTIGSVILLITVFNGLDIVTQSEINTIYFFFAIVVYITYFKYYYEIIFYYIPYVVALQVAISLCQQLCMNIGYIELAMIFNNYPAQSNYIYPFSYGGLFRTSGLFNESSQYAIFLVSFVILYINNIIKRTKFIDMIFIVSIIDFFINESITAYIILFLYLFYKVIILRNALYLKMIFFFSLAAIPLLFQSQLNSIFGKIIGTFMMSSESFVRVSSALNKVHEVLHQAPFLGLGLSWGSISFDIVSVYIYAYGLVGLLTILLFIVYISIHTRNSIIFIFLLYIFTNASLLGSMNILLIGLAYSLVSFERRNDDNSLHCDI